MDIRIGLIDWVWDGRKMYETIATFEGLQGSLEVPRDVCRSHFRIRCTVVLSVGSIDLNSAVAGLGAKLRFRQQENSQSTAALRPTFTTALPTVPRDPVMAIFILVTDEYGRFSSVVIELRRPKNVLERDIAKLSARLAEVTLRGCVLVSARQE